MQVEFLRIDGRLVNVNSVEGKERMKWERQHNPNDPANQFPIMLYKAQRRPDQVWSTNEVNDFHFGGRLGSADEFSRRCHSIVGSVENTYEQNQKLLTEALERGWRKTQLEALARAQALDEATATAAAHRHYEDRNMGELAKAEAAAADEASPEHLPTITEKRRGRKPGSKNRPKETPPPAA